MPTVHVHLSPHALDHIDLHGSLAVVIDLLRASTTITHALAAGAAAVVPCETIEIARERAAASPPGSFLLGGERKGVRIEGFDLGNSPTEYTPDRVRGKTIIFTTTNGTLALLRVQRASRILIGCFSNLTAVTAAARMSGLHVHIMCAGIHGEPCREDTVCAGALAEALVAGGLRSSGEQTNFAIEVWRTISTDGRPLADSLVSSEGGQNLLSAGLGSDIPTCASIDSRPLVPEWDAARRVLRCFQHP